MYVYLCILICVHIDRRRETAQRDLRRQCNDKIWANYWDSPSSYRESPSSSTTSSTLLDTPPSKEPHSKDCPSQKSSSGFTYSKEPPTQESSRDPNSKEHSSREHSKEHSSPESISSSTSSETPLLSTPSMLPR
jgi:hypothetical protein